MRGVILFYCVERDRKLQPCRLRIPGALRPLLVTRAAAGSNLARTNLVAGTQAALAPFSTVAITRAGITSFVSVYTYALAIRVNLAVLIRFESACTSVLTVFVKVAGINEIPGSAYTYALTVFILIALIVGSGTLHTAGEGAGPCLRGREQGKDADADQN